MIKIEVEDLPRGVIFYLKEMKNILELMTDLAYSSILLNDKTLAEDVFELEEKMDSLLQNLSKELMLSHLPPSEVDVILPVFKIASASEEVSDALRTIASLSFVKVGEHSLIHEALEEADRRPYRIIVNESSTILNKVVTDDFLSKAGFRILAFKKKGGDWVYSPEKTPKIKLGDVLIIKGPKKNQSKLEKLFNVSLS